MPSPSHSVALHSGLRTYGPYIAGALVLLIAPYFFYPLFLAKILCFALFACAFNLLLGSCGLLSFGHAAFYGAAAYVAAHAAKEWGLPFEVSIVLGMLAAGTAAFGEPGGLLSSVKRSRCSGVRAREACNQSPPGCSFSHCVLSAAMTLRAARSSCRSAVGFGVCTVTFTPWIF